MEDEKAEVRNEIVSLITPLVAVNRSDNTDQAFHQS